MSHLPQSIIFQVERGQDVKVAARQFVSQKDDVVIEVFDHKKKDGVKVGIFVDDIRGLIEMVRTSRKSHRTIVIIADAAKMTKGAQNSLLKLLEEPRDNLHIVLSTENSKTLLPTILSRCQIFKSASYKVSDIPESKRSKAIFMAGGNQSELYRLTKDDNYYNKQVELFETAKQFISAKKYQRLQIISKVKDSRDEALDLIRASLAICRFLLKTKPSASIHQHSKKLLQADKAIRENGNVRLWLLKTVL
ncbi:hypothetical protein GX865_01040 [Candidatus Saccharibacteria bacterium]|jgi:hypothetical protein|nr:hypothetical protein [Candidatus Saccharibacteria bacterium]